MKKALMLAPMASVHRRFNGANITALQELGYQVELCANFEDGDGPEVHNQKFKEDCVSKGIICHSILFERHSLIGCLKCLPALKDLLKKENYDIIHAHTETGGLLLRMVGKISGKKFFTPHGMSFWKGSSMKSQLLYKPLERLICSGMEQNLGMNIEEFEYLANWNSHSANYVHGIGLNVQRIQSPLRDKESLRCEFGILPHEMMIVSIGELDDNKNHVTVIKALSKIEHRDYKYVICGVGPNKDFLLEEASKLGIGNNVILAGYRSDIPDILNAADLFVFPSYHEGLPVSALEAMAAGLPILCSKIRGNVDLIKDKINGYLFVPTDIDTLSRKLSILMNDAIIRKEMGNKNKEIVKEFSMESVTTELKFIYSK